MWLRVKQAETMPPLLCILYLQRNVSDFWLNFNNNKINYKFFLKLRFLFCFAEVNVSSEK